MIYKHLFEIISSVLILFFLMLLLIFILPGEFLSQEFASVHVTSNYLSKSVDFWQWHSLYRPERSVFEIIGEAISHTFWINLISIFLVYMLTFFLSFMYMYFSFSWIKKTIRFFCHFFIHFPLLILAPLLIYFFSVKWSWFSLVYQGNKLFFVLPVIVLILKPVSIFTIMMIDELLLAYQSRYVITARAKGLSRSAILFRHVMRNSLITLLTSSPQLIISIFSGSVLVEMFFSIPGIGLEFLNSLGQRDYPVILGIVFISGTSMIIVSQLFEWFSLFLNPLRQSNNEA